MAAGTSPLSAFTSHMRTRRSAMKLLLGAAGAVLLPRAAKAQSLKHGWVPAPGLVDALASRMEHFGVPGLAVAVVEDGVLAWQGHYGVAHVDRGRPVTQQTLFQAASLSKPVFAYVVMKLIDEGRLGLESRLADYVRPQGLSEDARLGAIEVRHVLSHTSGLPNWRDETLESTRLAPAFEAGTAYQYSGEAFYWLQQVVETILGAGIAELMRRYLFGPAGLDDMEMLWTQERDEREVHAHGLAQDGKPLLDVSLFRHEHLPRLHEVAQRWGRPMTSWTSHDLRSAHGVMRPHTAPGLAGTPLWRWNLPASAAIDVASSLRTTVGDYARFMTLMMAPSQSPARWQVSESSRRSMLTPQFDRPNKALLPPGLGWGLERRDDGNVFHHWGKNGNAHISVTLGDPARRRGLIAMTNGSNGAPLLEELVVALTGTAFASIV